MQPFAASAAVTALLSLLQAVSVVAQPIDHGTCTTLYYVINGSCKKLGTWGSSDDQMATICLQQGCYVTNETDNLTCTGDPSCDNPDFRSPRFCRAETVCSCSAGYKPVDGKCVEVCRAGYRMYRGSCREIICQGKYVLDERWDYQISGGWKYLKCVGREKMDVSASCSRLTPFWDGHDKCYATAP